MHRPSFLIDLLGLSDGALSEHCCNIGPDHHRLEDSEYPQPYYIHTPYGVCYSVAMKPAKGRSLLSAVFVSLGANNAWRGGDGWGGDTTTIIIETSMYVSVFCMWPVL